MSSDHCTLPAIEPLCSHCPLDLSVLPKASSHVFFKLGGILPPLAVPSYQNVVPLTSLNWVITTSIHSLNERKFLSPPLKALGSDDDVMVLDGSDLAYVALGSCLKLYVENGSGLTPPVPNLNNMLRESVIDSITELPTTILAIGIVPSGNVEVDTSTSTVSRDSVFIS